MSAVSFILWMLLIFDPNQGEWIPAAESNSPEYLVSYALYHDVPPEYIYVIIKGVDV